MGARRLTTTVRNERIENRKKGWISGRGESHDLLNLWGTSLEERVCDGYGPMKLFPRNVAVILFNLGGPETLEEVEPFLLNLFSDPDIMDLPPLVRTILPRFIARRRAPKSRGYYAAIGGGSPLRSITDDQARLLEESLNGSEKASSLFKVFVAMRYAPPRLRDLLEPLRAFSPDHLVLLPLYPQRSTTTTRSSFREFLKIAPQVLPIATKPVLHVLPAYPTFPSYIEALYETVDQALDRIPGNDFPVDILFSAHGIPESRIRKGDPYQKDTEATVREVTRLLEYRKTRPFRIHLSYQSRVGPLRWLGPETKTMIRNLSVIHGCKNLILVPISFVSDHQETLYEMDITYRDLSRELTILHFERASALNLQSSFISALKDLTLSTLNGKVPSSSPCNCQCGACPRESLS